MERVSRVVSGMFVSIALLAGGAGWAEDTSQGEKLYAENCAKCHGDDGRAQTPVGKAMKASSLVDAKWAAGDSTSALIAAVRANAKHQAVAKLSDEELTAIAGYVRQLASAGE